jgi:methyl-accepting chemotaxis protein
MATMNRRKLRNYFINRELQLRIIFTNLIYMFLIVVITVGVVLFPLVCDMFMSQDLVIQYRAGQEFLAAIKRLVPVAIIIFILVSLHQVFITHRVFGPIWNFTRTFKRVSSGDLTRKVFIRKNDFMDTEKNRINHMIDGLSHLVFRIRNNHRRLISVLEEAMSHIEDPGARRSVDSAMEIIRREAEFVTEDLALFEIDNGVMGK